LSGEHGTTDMAFRPNYQQQRGDRNRAKEEKKRERLQRREEDAQRRKSERDGLLGPGTPSNETDSGAPSSEKD
jgi:hypothetical protein